MTDRNPYRFNRRQKVHWIDLDRIEVDDEYQRNLKANHIDRMIREFDVRYFGVVVLSLREDGAYFIIDGQQRISAFREIVQFEKVPPKVPAIVIEGLTPQEEAGAFLGLNGVVTQSTFEKFRARHRFGDPAVREIAGIVHGVGLEIHRFRGPNTIASVASLELVYRGFRPTKDLSYPKVLEQTLRAITERWDPRGWALSADIIKGLGIIFHRVYPVDWIDRDRVEWAISSFKSADQLRTAAITWADATSRRQNYGVSRAILEKYNHGLHSQRKIAPDYLRKIKLPE